MPPLRMHSSTMMTRCVLRTEFWKRPATVHIARARQSASRGARVEQGMRRGTSRWGSGHRAYRNRGLVKRLERDEVNHLRVVAGRHSLLHRLLHHVAVTGSRLSAGAGKRARACAAARTRGGHTRVGHAARTACASMSGWCSASPRGPSPPSPAAAGGRAAGGVTLLASARYARGSLSSQGRAS
jgi:hypothetical protein